MKNTKNHLGFLNKVQSLHIANLLQWSWVEHQQKIITLDGRWEKEKRMENEVAI